MFTNLRISALISLLVVTIIISAAGWFFRTIANDDLMKLVGQNNTSLAQGYHNAVWKPHHDAVSLLSGSAPDNAQPLRNNPKILQFAQDTIHYFQKMPLVRVNIYTAQGQLLMTSDTSNKLAGNAASPDADFIATHLAQKLPATHVLSKVALKNDKDAILVQTLVPLSGNDSAGTNEGAVELIYDISEPWGRMLTFQLCGTGAIIFIFLLFLAIIFIAAGKEENIIARQHEANLELAEAAAAAQAENHEKSQFLANVSHELRTPLNAIIGFSEIMKNEVMIMTENEKYNHYINDIHSSGVHLLSLINDILDYSKAEAGKLELEVSEVNASKMVQNSMRLLTTRAESAEVKLTDNLPKEPFIMITDSKKLKQILLNLLSNAVKFTQAGGEVKISGWRNVEDDSFSFEVADSGIGIAPKDIALAMAPFGQIDNGLRRKYEGTGLGLPLTKKFVELMGGKFTISSQQNVGTTITFTLPREIKERSGLVIKQLS